MRLPASPSRRVLTIGMPPATAASKPIVTWFASARRASSAPWWASRALFAVTTGLPAPSAAWHSANAGPSAPPISSTTTSTSGSAASASASSYQRKRARSTPRARSRWRAETAVTLSSRPARSASRLPFCASSLSTALPTVPSPAMPRRSGSAIGSGHRSRPLRRAPAEERLDVAHSLADALAVLDQGEAHEALAVLAKAEARRDRDPGFAQQELAELERANCPIRLGDRRPHEHGRGRRRDRPADRPQPLDQDVTALAVSGAVLGDKRLAMIERGGGRYLDRRERAVVQVRLDPGERRDQLRVAGRETDAPAGHRIGLAQRAELDRDLLGARHLQDRGRRLGEVDLGIGQLGQQQDIVAAGGPPRP